MLDSGSLSGLCSSACAPEPIKLHAFATASAAVEKANSIDSLWTKYLMGGILIAGAPITAPRLTAG
jgi:hypothetical protein